MRPKRFSSPSIYLALFKMLANMLLKRLEEKRRGIHPLGGFRFFSTCVKTHSVL